MDEHIINFLKKCEIPFDSKQLDGHLLPREIMLSDTIYNKVRGDLDHLREKYSSSYLTALQKTAEIDQKWPLLNLVRQLLKMNSYIMKPVRKSDGYTKEGKKKFRRFFVIQKVKSVK